MKNTSSLATAVSVAAEDNTTNNNGLGKNGNQPEDEGRESRRRNGENGFEEWGGYMAAKKAKLDVQFNNGKHKASSGLGIFNGMSIYINGYTDPPEPQLREMFILNGGTFHPYNSSKTNFVIATNLSVPSKNLYASKTVKPEWITESIAAGIKLDPRKYMLYNLNEEKNQRTLTQVMGKKGTVASDEPNYQSNGSTKVSELTNGHTNHNGINQNGDNTADNPDVQVIFSKEFEQPVQIKAVNACQPPVTPTRRKVKMATEDGFLEEFFRNSRLHLISDQKKEMLNKIGEMRKNVAAHKFDNLELFEKEIKNGENGTESTENYFPQKNVILMHIDFDCFFVSVGLLSRPHLRGKPIVVTHSTGKTGNSKSDIACASYEARKFGVKNGMWVSGAKELCPSLEVIPYDFEEYRRISELFFNTVASMTLDIEPCSVDEMVVNVTSILNRVPGSTPENLAEFIRRKVFESTKCPASIGIGSNRLLAKLATKKAKPNGLYHLKDTEAQEFIKDLGVEELPGVGYSHGTKLLEEFGVKTCKELLEVPLKDLKKSFGDKTAEKMLSACRGRDTAELKYGFDRPKSISVDVNYGIRFTKDDEVADFMIKLCQELSNRASKAQATSSHLTVKILVRQKGAGDPKKHGGHGLVDTITKSSKFLQPTKDWQDMFKSSTRLLKLMSLPPSDYRGIGLSLTDLRFEFDKSDNQKKSIQTTLFDKTTSRGRKMVEFAMKAAGAGNDEKKKQSETAAENPPAPEVKHQSTSCNTENDDSVSPLKVARKKFAVNGTLPTSSSDPQDPVDINVLRELPRDIAREMALHYGLDVASLEDRGPGQPEEIVTLEPDVPSSQESLRQKDASVGTTEDNGLEDAIRQSIAESMDTANNPYDSVDQVDPSFLCALPDAIRNEVLMQVQEAKGRKDVNPLPTDEPQPCSSKQALERDRALNKAKLNPIEDIEAYLKQPINVACEEEYLADADTDVDLSCDEMICQDDDLPIPLTPPSASICSENEVKIPSPKTTPSSNTGNVTTPKSSRKRLFTAESPCEKKTIDWESFWSESSDVRYIPFKPINMPALNTAVNIDKVRAMIRNRLEMEGEPSLYETGVLRKYFDELISLGWLEQTRTLLRFIHRKSVDEKVDSRWRNILTEIVNTTQKKCRRSFGCIVSLK